MVSLNPITCIFIETNWAWREKAAFLKNTTLDVGDGIGEIRWMENYHSEIYIIGSNFEQACSKVYICINHFSSNEIDANVNDEKKHRFKWQSILK